VFDVVAIGLGLTVLVSIGYAPGEDFIRTVYLYLTSNLQLWKETALIITYDEHGGFFDHVPPPAVPTAPPKEAKWKTTTSFTTLGVRVPALVVSPYVKAGTVCHETFDHTSILQLLADRFAPGKGFSPEVNQRRDGVGAEVGIASVAAVFNQASPRKPTLPPPPAPQLGKVVKERKPTRNSQAFANAAKSILSKRKAEAVAKYPQLDAWKKVHG